MKSLSHLRLASLLFNEKYLIKEERIAKAKQLYTQVFDLGSEAKNKVIEDILTVLDVELLG